MVKILNTFPPNYSKIKRWFGLTGNKVIFSYGDTIFNPYRCMLPPCIVAHETAYCVRQSQMGAVQWWERYCEDVAFRRDEEIIGHRAEFESRLRVGEKHALKITAERLSHKIYGPCISYEDALKELQ